MRWATRAVLVAAVGLAGCGNYSTEDLRFLAALPSREDLRVEVPVQAATATATVASARELSTAAATLSCPSGSADVWLWAKPTSDGLNAAVEFVLAFVDLVRRHPPSWREEDARGWGPFEPAEHPGREVRVVIRREYPAERDGEPLHVYAFQARVKGAADFTNVIEGSFAGASAARGSGGIVLDFEALWTLSMAEADTPHGALQIAYDRASEPVTIALSLAQGGFGVVRFDYAFAGYLDGSGAFDYALRDASGDLLTIATGYDAAGAGRGRVAFTAASGGTGVFDQCWDGGACLVYVDDPANYSCDAGAGCSFGAVEACAAVPAPPF